MRRISSSLEVMGFYTLEVRVIHHHHDEKRGQRLEGVVDEVNECKIPERRRLSTSFHHGTASRAHHLGRHILHHQKTAVCRTPQPRNGTRILSVKNILHVAIQESSSLTRNGLRTQDMC